MPTKKKSTVTARNEKLRSKKVLKARADHNTKVSHLCQSCHSLPTGSIELVSLLLVLVFALSAVLVTSVYALNKQASEISTLQAQVTLKE